LPKQLAQYILLRGIASAQSAQKGLTAATAAKIKVDRPVLRPAAASLSVQWRPFVAVSNQRRFSSKPAFFQISQIYLGGDCKFLT